MCRGGVVIVNCGCMRSSNFPGWRLALLHPRSRSEFCLFWASLYPSDVGKQSPDPQKLIQSRVKKKKKKKNLNTGKIFLQRINHFKRKNTVEKKKKSKDLKLLAADELFQLCISSSFDLGDILQDFMILGEKLQNKSHCKTINFDRRCKIPSLSL